MESRLRQLQTGTPEFLEVLGAIDAGPAVERAVHNFLASHNVRGEWFEREAALSLLARLKDRSNRHRSEFVERLLFLQVHDPRDVGSMDGEVSLEARVAYDILMDLVDDLGSANTANPIPFRAWLLTQQDRDDPTGDLAKDVARDSKFPPIGALRDYLAYIMETGCRAAVTRTVIDAWIECDIAAADLPYCDPSE